ncbi:MULTISPECIES: MotA/TolQ/ExbB proton channel family protein [Desulfobacula]|uniref:Predicted biopolymer transport protein related to ExbB n=2 Tax=Desulfobacula TaxID=28222 RepID=K0NSY2_DESTT|nr:MULTISPECIES: MotA/TolQ/ExbB proton channel family protein [Desulfobacula]CCK82117.1 predicted biopolymer transport protein related to ExbB [Desulfobacula toluolica Tol2]SDU46480.1 biopolymer transport protein ExbB [Desulfobacula phenolica]
MLDFLSKGGMLVIPIIFCSVIVLAIFFERIIRYAVNRNRGKNIEHQVTQLMKLGDTDQALAVSKKSRSPMGRVLEKAIDARDMESDVLESVIANATENEVRGLSSYLQALATIGNIAPLLGLLGTIIGMIKAFMVIQQMGGKVNAAVLAGGIWEAMLTTALGLAVALPTMVAHSYLIAKVDMYEARLQNGSILFLKAISKKVA